MSGLAIHGVPADQVESWWPVLVPYLEGFAERSDGRVTTQSLVDDIRARARQVWVAGGVDGVVMVALTRVGAEPSGDLSVYIDHCAGERSEEWREAYDEAIRQWAAAMGARRIFSMARPGWSKWAKTRGYRELHREMMLEVA